jgi:hypothetical protein
MRRGRRFVTGVGCLAALSGAGAVGAPAVTAQQALPPASPPGAQRVSDERSETRWAYPERRAKVRSRPSGRARTVTRLRLLTEDRFPELYVVLSRWVDPHANEWLKVRLPMRPNGRTGWVPRNALAEFKAVHKYIDVDKRRLRVRLFDRGKVVFRARVGVGKAGTPTPSGTYYIREKFKVRGVPLYGTHAIGTSAYAPTLSDWPGGGVVGMHGTNQPGLIPGRPSHGCMRLKNRDIARLYRLAPRGTPIHIH